MNIPRLGLAMLSAALLAACSTLPPVDLTPGEEEEAPVELTQPQGAPLIESPPIEPVEPVEPVEPPVSAPAPTPPAAPAAAPQPPAVPQPTPAPLPVPVPAPTAPTPAPAPVVTVPSPAPAPVPAPEPTEDQVVAALVGDLARYASLAADEVKKEIPGATQALAKQRTDANRVRLAMLYTLTRSPQDEQRALQLLENVAKSNPGSPAIKHLGSVLQAQVAERIRAVREEQQKGEVAIQKLEALRVLERNLLRDRVRSGGGGAGGGGSGSGGGSGGR